MKISYNWLKTYINCNLPYQEVAEALTSTGLEVEDSMPFESVKGGLKGIVTGKVISCEPHPNADRLSLTKVDVGSGELLSIVCGAPNVAKDQKVLVATIGTTLYSGDDSFQIKKSKIRGELSEGMICAEDELGLGHSHEGIMVLPEETEIGKPATDYFPVEEDVIFEIGLTPNRSDATSHIGVARDLMAVLNHRAGEKKYSLKLPELDAFMVDNSSRDIEVRVENPEACPRYSGLTISGFKVADSPAWLTDKLKSIGVRPINNIVDITNYVLFETGQPLHAFDADKVIGEKVVVKTLAENTPFVSLDGVERKLSSEDLMICNAEKPMCIAGVFGGLDSGVTAATTSIFLESACFNARSVRKTARRHALQTDASFRFERGADVNITVFALKRAAMLIQQIAGGKITSEIKDVIAQDIQPAQVQLYFDYLNKMAGQKIEATAVKNILLDLDMKITAETAEFISMLVPTFRVEVTRPADVVEEILRIYGYDNILIPSKINASMHAGGVSKNDTLQQQIADLLAFNGFYEIMNNSLTKSAYTIQHPAFDENKNVKILNPLSSELDVMRQTLLFGGLESIAYNINRKSSDLKFFEFGTVYAFDEKAIQTAEKTLAPYKEHYCLDLFMTGRMHDELWNQDDKDVDLYALKYFAEAILSKMSVPQQKLILSENPGEPYEYGLSYTLNEKPLLTLGNLSKKTLKIADINKAVFHATINWSLLLKHFNKTSHKLFEAVPKFPAVTRDLALVVDQSVSFETIKNIALQTEKKLLQSVSIFDVYEGDKIPEGKKSYALKFILQDKEKTLTDKLIDKSMQKILSTLEQQVGASLRT
ncbi:MAG: phenylalanine--tRNA ligase subunit beta [Bacteroidales bacterium]|jgi:phenylalanyl-tRNA synthetase beta chain|nr:phenylalanine--tRNA ligase subunit beta [Bacteroidales bacterium]